MSKRIHLSVALNGEHYQTFTVKVDTVVPPTARRWWQRPQPDVVPQLSLVIDGHDHFAYGDEANLTIDIPVRLAGITMPHA